jgi:hypothetical protein
MIPGSCMDEYGTKVATVVGSTRHLIMSIDEDMKLRNDCSETGWFAACSSSLADKIKPYQMVGRQDFVEVR